MSATTSVALSPSMGASAASTPHLPEQTPSATTRYPTTPSLSANSSLPMNGTNSIGDVLALSEAFASSMVHYAERQNISDADLIFEICSPTAVRNATKNLSHTDLNVLVQTCATVGLEEDHTLVAFRQSPPCGASPKPQSLHSPSSDVEDAWTTLATLR
jgi:hypothetical protein